MAIVGLSYAVVAPIVTEPENGIPVYGKGTVAGRMMTADVSWDYSDEKMYADNIVAEADKSITSGTVTYKLDEVADAAKKIALSYGDDAEDTGALVAYGTSSPNVGTGFIGHKVFHGVDVFLGIWVYKVQFGLGSQSYTTKQDRVAFEGETLEGSAYPIKDSDSKPRAFVEKRFETEAAAKAWLDAFAQIGA